MLRRVCTIIAALNFYSLTSYSQDSLKILSWNIKMLPAVAKGDGRAKRAKAIVNQLKNNQPDVIVFQELFNRRGRKIVTTGLKELYPHQTKVLNRKSIAIKANGGVLIISKHPIRSVSEVRYHERSGFDKYARKGALLAEIEFKGKSVHVAGTHLQAFGAQEIMYAQYKQLGEFLKSKAKPGVPQFIVGDFNTIKTLPPQLPADVTAEMINRLPRYSQLLLNLDAEDGDLAGAQQFTMDRPYNDLCKTRKDYRLLLDYAFFRPNGISGYSLKRQVRILRQSWNKEHQDLSDHYALETVFTGF